MRRRRATTLAAGLALLVAGAAAPLAAAAAPAGSPVDPADAGEAIAFGDPAQGRTAVPPLPAGLSYTAAAAGKSHTVLLRSDGAAVAFGDDTYLQSDIPPLPAGLHYTGVAAGNYHTVLLRSDGAAVIAGMEIIGAGVTTVPPLPAGMSYTEASAGAWHTALLRSDGNVIAFGYSDDGRTTVPPLPPGVVYTAVASGSANMVLLRSDGQVVITGLTAYGTPYVTPPLPPGLVYTAVAAGDYHAVLLRSDGAALAVGYNVYGQTDVPALPAGTTYTAIAAGHMTTVLLRSDGAALVLGNGASGQTSVPALPTGARYTAGAAGEAHTVLIRATPPPPVSTVTSLSGATDAHAGDTITLTATVTPASAGSHDGTVRFSFEDASTVDVPLASDGTATTTRTLPSGGLYTATASYLGSVDGSHLASGPSGAVTTTVPYRVDFDAGGGSGVPPALVAPGGLVPEPVAPTRAGHGFTGWHTGDATGPSWDFAHDPVTADLTLHASWQPESPTPHLVLSHALSAPGESVTVTGSGFAPGAALTLTLNPTLGTVIVDGTGAFTFVFTMPAVAPGPHAVTAHAGTATGPVLASAAITVAAASDPGSAPAPGLAATGAADAPSTAAGSIAALLLGVALAFAARVRRRSRTTR